MSASRAGAGSRRIGWSTDFIVVDAGRPAIDELERIDRSRAKWVLIVRGRGQYLYVFTRDEIWERLRRSRVPYDPHSKADLTDVLDLHETQVSTPAQRPSPNPAPPDLSWRPGETSPSVHRYVYFDAAQRPQAVGGPDVEARATARAKPPTRPPVKAASKPPVRRPAAAAAPSLPAPASAVRAPADLPMSAPPPDLPGLGSGPARRMERARAIDVEAPAGGAAPDDVQPATADDEGTTPVRHPAIDADGPLAPGAPLTIVVDLRREAAPDTTGGAISLGAQAADWSTLEVGVTLVSAGIDFDGGGRGKVTIRRNQDSTAARIAGHVVADAKAGDEIDVFAQFWLGTRASGSAQRRFTVQPAGARVPAPAAPTQGAMQADPSAAQPDLTVYITLFDRARPGAMHWRMVCAEFPTRPPKLDGLIDLGQDPAAEAAAMFKQFANLERGKHRARIEGFGERLWDRSPAEFKAAYWALHDHLQRPLAIQFVSDDPHLPWELMRPHRDSPARETHEPLALRHAVARWIGRWHGYMSNRLPAGRVVAIAPKYRSASARLSLAEATADELVAKVGAVREGGTLADLHKLLEQPGGDAVALLFFTGHGLFDATSAAASAIKLEDGNLAVDEVARREVTLGERHGTVVFFNACEVGATGGVLGGVGGWADAFLSRRFRGFIAPLWAVDEEDAAAVTRELVSRIVKDRAPVGAALRDLRAKHGDVSPTFFSYLLYGDVTARMAG